MNPSSASREESGSQVLTPSLTPFVPPYGPLAPASWVTLGEVPQVFLPGVFTALWVTFFALLATPIGVFTLPAADPEPVHRCVGLSSAEQYAV